MFYCFNYWFYLILSFTYFRGKGRQIYQKFCCNNRLSL